ncbi:MAG: phospholipase effector Tle1 domain-containing protein [Janthinobacterium lividum]
MGAIISSLPGSVAGGVGIVVVGERKRDTREPVDIVASVFFDGTGNNRTNTTLRLEQAKGGYVSVDGRQVKVEGSYESYYSNVAVMQYMNLISDNLKEVSVYVEGIGTTDGGDDDTMGMAFGAGATGVPAKVARGILLLTERITRILRQSAEGEGEGKRLNHLLVNVCGFSRGAAAARHFVARRTGELFKQYTSLSESLYVEAAAIEINFVGLFDTVSSYGGEEHTTVAGQTIHNRLDHSFDDDVQELHLAIGGHAREVVQLAAADEYRKNFASTTIASSVRAGVGLEVRLPGVHSDIGGSYQEHEEEVRNVSAADAQGYIREQWYTAAQLEPINVFRRWYQGRRTLTHHYQFIALAIMINQAKGGGKHEPMKFETFEGDNQKYAVPDELRPLYELMNAFVASRPAPSFGEAKPGLPPTHNDDYSHYQPAAYELLPEWYKIRNRYLHRSARKGEWTVKGLTMAGRETKHVPDRQIIQDLTP